MRVILSIAAVLLLAACDGSLPFSEPSALQFEERKAEVVQRATEARILIEANRGWVKCEPVIEAAARRSQVLDNAAFVAIIKEDGGLSEAYSIYGKLLDLYGDLEQDLEECSG